MDLTLGQKQELFSGLAARLILHMIDSGYQCRLGEVQRTIAQATLNAKSGVGIANSLHILKLAIDINLFKDGIAQDVEGHRQFGEWWKQQNILCRWGGDFVHLVDADHYSITHGGIS